MDTNVQNVSMKEMQMISQHVVALLNNISLEQTVHIVIVHVRNVLTTH